MFLSNSGNGPEHAVINHAHYNGMLEAWKSGPYILYPSAKLSCVGIVPIVPEQLELSRHAAAQTFPRQLVLFHMDHVVVIRKGATVGQYPLSDRSHQDPGVSSSEPPKAQSPKYPTSP